MGFVSAATWLVARRSTKRSQLVLDVVHGLSIVWPPFPVPTRHTMLSFRSRSFSPALALVLLASPAIAAFTASCSSEDPPPAPASCVGAGLAAQPRTRFIVG